jgi:hypothetical protein
MPAAHRRACMVESFVFKRSDASRKMSLAYPILNT